MQRRHTAAADFDVSFEINGVNKSLKLDVFGKLLLKEVPGRP